MYPEHSIARHIEALTFTLGDEEYAVSILTVQEIRGYGAVTSIANAPAFVKGVINLRGMIVPIVDMRILLGDNQPSYNEFVAVIVLTVSGNTAGIVVDGVSDVVTLKPEQIKPAPGIATSSANADYVIGLGTINDRMLILVDMDKLMDRANFSLIEAAA